MSEMGAKQPEKTCYRMGMPLDSHAGRPYNKMNLTVHLTRKEESPMRVNEMKQHLTEKILPFWERLTDWNRGGG